MEIAGFGGCLMAIPGSVVLGAFSVSAPVDRLVYPSVCSLLANTKTNVGGQDVNSFALAPSVPVDIPCRLAPMILVRPQVQEQQRGQFQQEDANFVVCLDQYVDGVSREWQLVVDGKTYQIISVEWDGNKITSRFGVSDIKPFNA